MKTFTNILLIIAATSQLVIAEDKKVDYGFKSTKEVRVEGYEFKFIKAEPDKNHWRMGYFQFRWDGAEPINLSGFGFQKDGSLRVRFEQFSKMTSGEWKEVTVGYCGTGKQTFALEPKKDYVLQIPLWPYEKDGDEGVIKLSGENVSVISEPFKVAAIRVEK